MNNFPRPSPTKMSFPELVMKLKKNNKTDNRILNIKKQNTNMYNNVSIHHIFDLKNKNKLTSNNLKKEEHKNIINNNRNNDLLEKVIASPLNNNINKNINKIKKIQYINTTNKTDSNIILINNHFKKSESSIENNSDTIINSKLENKISDSLIYLEDDNFFMEEDNIGINIPHS